MKTWFLVVLVYGQVIESNPNPMTARDCAREATLWIESFGNKVLPEKYSGGNEVALNDVEVKCARRRH